MDPTNNNHINVVSLASPQFCFLHVRKYSTSPTFRLNTNKENTTSYESSDSVSHKSEYGPCTRFFSNNLGNVQAEVFCTKNAIGPCCSQVQLVCCIRSDSLCFSFKKCMLMHHLSVFREWKGGGG